ncbi:hypothetical protein HYH02_008639 [Chlamydomonas schloesseri]|uniref:Uncharacterized protein n=1 Tax=Chlamydomonas schloesseri TaxID=2026947 RepID=A0A835WD99_9CHLO|nr:hypothetical protein HYH02_008639 [Chlamydomonas schloesseri]|eukprot:KAG2445171.1 hypothetical protein HYH02_008639 [Chlamydomonas schloesseri]
MQAASGAKSLARRSAIAESFRCPTSSRCRAVWAFAVDRASARSRHQDAHGFRFRCPRWTRASALGTERGTVVTYSSADAYTQTLNTSNSNTAAQGLGGVDAAPGSAGGARGQQPQPASATSGSGPGAHDAASAVPGSGSGPDASAAAPPPDPDAVLDEFVSAFGLPRQKLLTILQRQPALARANPRLLAERIAAYTRVTGLSAYQLLYVVARRPAVLQLPPPALSARLEALSEGLSLSREDVLKMLLSQPAFVDVPPDALRLLAIRVAGELRVRPPAALRVLAGLPPGELRGILARPPGMLRERLAGLRRLLKQTFGSRRATPRAALLLVARCPLLLALPNKAVEASLAAFMSIPPTKSLAASAGGSGGVAAAGNSNSASTSSSRSMLKTLLACPHVLTLPPETLRGRFVTLAAAARIDLPAAVSMLLLQPRLLLVDPARVRARLEGLTFSLMVPRKTALDMVVRQPQLLIYQTESLAENWAALQGLLGVTFEATMSMVARHPNLLCIGPAMLTSKLAALEALFALPHARAVLLCLERPVLLTYSERRYKLLHRTLSSLIPLTPPALGRLVLAHSYLLLEDPMQLTSKASDAASLLALTEADVGNMLGRSPAFITRDFRHWQTNLDTITSSLGVRLEHARAAVFRYPGLMAADPAELHRSASSLMSLVRTSPAWLAQLEAVSSPDVVFKCLRGHNPRTLAHLRFLVDAGLQKKQSFISPIIWDRATFIQRYPAFVEWQAARAAAAVAPNGLPLRRPRLTKALSVLVADEVGDAAGGAAAWRAAEEPSPELPSEAGSELGAYLGQQEEAERAGGRRDGAAAGRRVAVEAAASAPDMALGSSEAAASTASAGNSGTGAAAPSLESARPSAGVAEAATDGIMSGAGVSVAAATSSSSSSAAGGAGGASTGSDGGAAQPGSGRASSTKLATKPVRGAVGRGAGAVPAAGPAAPVLRAIPRRQQVIRMPSVGSSVDEEPL